MSVEMDEEEVAEMQKKYARRELGTNVDRYKEPEPELDSEGACIRTFENTVCDSHIRTCRRGDRRARS